MPVPPGYTIDSSAPGVKLPPGYTLDAPQHVDATPNFTANPNHEGTYKMVGPSGQGVDVPFSKVRSAQDSSFQVAGPDADRYQKDAAAAHPRGFWGALSDNLGVAAGAPQTAGRRLVGNAPISDVAGVVGQHLKNMVAAPYHAFVDGPQNPQESQDKGTDATSGPMNVLGQFGLGASRLLVAPTRNALKSAATQAKAGNFVGDEYDAQGNYHPNAVGSLADAIPLAGGWARNVDNDTHQHGLVAGLAGLGTDIAVPAALGKVAAVLRPAAKAAAIGDVTRMIRPNATDVAFGKSPAEGLLSQPGGVMSWSKEALLDRSRASVGGLGQQIQDAVAAAPQTPMNVSAPVINPFSIALKDAAKSNQGGLFGRLQEARQGYTNNMIYSPSSESIIDGGPANLTSMTPSDVFALKKRVGDNTKWTNQAFDNDLNATQGKVYGGLKDALNTAVPSLAPLNEAYGNLRAGVAALERRIPIEARNNAVSLPDMVGGAGAAAATSLPMAAVGLAAKKALFSTPLRTVVDTGLYRFGTNPVKPVSPVKVVVAAPKYNPDQ